MFKILNKELLTKFQTSSNDKLKTIMPLRNF